MAKKKSLLPPAVSPEPVEGRLPVEKRGSTSSPLTGTSSALTVTSSPPTALPSPSPPQKPRKPRHDGWTEARRKTFLAVLHESGCVADACRVVGISTTSAYRLRERDAEMAARWEEAQANAQRGLVAVAHQHAVVGKETVIYRHGEEVERRVTPSDSILALLIKRGDLAGAGVALNADQVISWEEWQQGMRFDPDGRKVSVREEQERVSASLKAKLLALRERMQGSGERSINIRTGKGIDQAVIDAVLRVAGDGARVVEGVEWDEGVDWESVFSRGGR